jgi:SAM-dependent methyltransferase
MNPYDVMLDLLRRYHSDRPDIPARLGRELLIVGHSVAEDFVRLDVGPPWVYSDRMERFYTETDAFVIQLLAWHHQPSRMRWRDEIAKRINDTYPDGARVLCLGDGIGVDSFHIARDCRHASITSFEFEGHSSRFAARRADDFPDIRRRLRFVHGLQELGHGSFDVVVCLDVLEHVPDPLAIIRDIAGYLRPCGDVFLSEAFGGVDPLHPTHLLTNLQYAGHTIRLFRDTGFRYSETFCGRVHRFRRGSPATARTLLREARADARLRAVGAFERLHFRRHYAGRDIRLTDWLLPADAIDH